MKDKLTLAYFVVLVNKEQQFPGNVPNLRGVPSDHYLLDISRLEKLSNDSSMSSSKSNIHSFYYLKFLIAYFELAF